ncbi:MAG: branched-chain amino acid ABC transporter permease [Rhodospirillales bacterium]|nr:branched-chain amino acid ABC transporter permease [Rhodospirillales bacterium]MDE0378383.1 branched-chain amino acid ABC transporter permease [Rhodospirillales bacterium]MDE0389522.1 branched-chain amino acid ABC transporter permease [Rhodospirillales bacterium]
METVSFIVSLLYQYADTIGVLALSAIGLIIIFGMMGVINMAHGEMMMIGAYITSFAYFAGVPSGIAVVFGALGAGLAGIVLERLIIRRFYGQLLSSLVATWGLSLLLSQGALLIFGPQIKSVPTPFGSFALAELSYSYYRLFMLGIALITIAGLWALFRYTRFGVHARATMQNPRMARALGVDTERIYALTFGLGAGLAGLAGGLLALTANIGPFYGMSYTPQAFITVVVGGGADVITGLLASVLSLGAAKTIFMNQFNILLGHVAMLVLAFVIIRLMPAGISEWIERRRVRVRGR